jgi:hypothetical protein
MPRTPEACISAKVIFCGRVRLISDANATGFLPASGIAVFNIPEKALFLEAVLQSKSIENRLAWKCENCSINALAYVLIEFVCPRAADIYVVPRLGTPSTVALLQVSSFVLDLIGAPALLSDADSDRGLPNSIPRFDFIGLPLAQRPCSGLIELSGTT